MSALLSDPSKKDSATDIISFATPLS